MEFCRRSKEHSPWWAGGAANVGVRFPDTHPRASVFTTMERPVDEHSFSSLLTGQSPDAPELMMGFMFR